MILLEKQYRYLLEKVNQAPLWVTSNSLLRQELRKSWNRDLDKLNWVNKSGKSLDFSYDSDDRLYIYLLDEDGVKHIFIPDFSYLDQFNPVLSYYNNTDLPHIGKVRDPRALEIFEKDIGALSFVSSGNWGYFELTDDSFIDKYKDTAINKSKEKTRDFKVNKLSKLAKRISIYTPITNDEIHDSQRSLFY